jgi:hypothetical protein
MEKYKREEEHKILITKEKLIVELVGARSQESQTTKNGFTK